MDSHLRSLASSKDYSCQRLECRVDRKQPDDFTDNAQAFHLYRLIPDLLIQGIVEIGHGALLNGSWINNELR